MEVVLGKGIALHGFPRNIVKLIRDTFVEENPVYVRNKKRKLPTWGVEKKIPKYVEYVGKVQLGRGMLDELSDLLTTIKCTDFGFTDERVKKPSTDFGTLNASFDLRSYQEKAIATMIENEYGVLVSPAGSGKTVMGLEIVRRLQQPTLWLVHTEELIKQTKEKAEKLLSNVGRVGLVYGKKKDLGDGKLIIASVKTLIKHEEFTKALYNYVGCTILDEAHHAPSTTFMEVIAGVKSHYLIGLTATPNRPDGLQFLMEASLGPIRIKIDREDLYKDGFLIKPEIKPVYTKFYYSQASKLGEKAVDAGGEDFKYHELLQALMEDEERSDLIAINIIESASKGRYQLVLADNKEYLATLYNKVEKYAQYAKKELRVAVVHATVGTKNRKDRMQDLLDKKLDVVFATQLAREGLDVVHLTDIHITTPRKGDYGNEGDGNALEQEIGRIMRPAQGKTSATIHDYVDYETGVLKSQYYTRRKTYKRLLLSVPRKPKSQELAEVEDFLKDFKL